MIGMRGDWRRTARGQDQRQGADGTGDGATGRTQAKHRASVERSRSWKDSPTLRTAQDTSCAIEILTHDLGLTNPPADRSCRLPHLPQIGYGPTPLSSCDSCDSRELRRILATRLYRATLYTVVHEPRSRRPPAPSASCRRAVQPQDIGHYEAIGLLPALRNMAGYRLYGAADRERLRFIAGSEGHRSTLREIRDILARRDGGGEPCPYVGELRAEAHRGREPAASADRAASGAPRAQGGNKGDGLLEHADLRSHRAAYASPSTRAFCLIRPRVLQPDSIQSPA